MPSKFLAEAVWFSQHLLQQHRVRFIALFLVIEVYESETPSSSKYEAVGLLKTDVAVCLCGLVSI